MKRLIVITLTQVIIGLISCSSQTKDLDNLDKVLERIRQIETASYYSTNFFCFSGDTIPIDEKTFEYFNEYTVPADTSVGAYYVKFELSDTTKMIFAYDGKMRARINWKENNFETDDFSKNPWPYRTVIAPFFAKSKALIEYALTTKDSIKIDSVFYKNSVAYKISIFNERVELVGRLPIHISELGSNEGVISEYIIWINRKTNLPYKFQRTLPANTMIEEISNLKINNLNRNNFAISNYIPVDMPTRTEAKIEGNAKLIAKNLNEKAEKYFKDYNANVDKDIFISMFEMYINDVPKDQQISTITTLEKKYKGDIKKWADDIYNKSILVDENRFNSFLQNPNLKTLENDLGFQITISTLSSARSIWQEMAKAEDQQNEGYRKYIAGLREMMPNKAFYPDANSTMRMTYGTVQDYYPADAVHYNYVTTLAGVIEKEDPTNDEFIVPDRLKELYNKKDFGQYADKNGNIVTCFITNNDITGGNSGSGVIDANGNLIGLAFDGNWESMSGDILYETSVQRCISVDIRYVLFIIDKYAGATNLINELTLVK